MLPRRLQIYIRRVFGKRARRTTAGVWPIKEAAGRKPDGWPGWPDGKQFALVLTHDVEGPRGVERVRQVAELEMACGFRSSFNFVPQGNYAIPPDLRAWLVDHGFEVGVQDLRHDARLYRSRDHFRQSAREINQYLHEWKAVGFRSAYMFHDLEWLQDLDVLYDSSTFDSDPFEPQPDGMDTIFPFWVARRVDDSTSAEVETRDLGYVELPYTLVQDFNLFIVLEEKSIDVWKRKLAWIAERGGMALLDTHPDYMSSGPGPGRLDEYPIDFYREWLCHIRDEYAGRYWHALPAAVAKFYKAECPRAPQPAHRRVCMLSYSFYETDNRVRRYAEALVKQGCSVDAISLRREDSQPDQEVIGGVTVRRIQKRRKDEKSSFQHLLRLCRFWFRSADLLRRSQSGENYDLVHVHNPPDFMAFAACFPKWRGAKIILDIHDAVPELYGNKFRSAAVKAIVGALKWVEKLSMRFADHVIVSNHLWHETIVARSVPVEKTSVFINHVDPAIFYPQARTRKDGIFTIVFPGSLSWHQGLDIAIKAVAKVRHELPSVQMHIYGSGHAKDDLVTLAKCLQLEEQVQFREVVPLDRVAEIMANADLGIVPKRADSFGNEAYSTKIMEFMSQGVPVIVSRTKIDSYYFDDSVVCFFEPENVDDLAESILRLARDQEYRDMLSRNALAFADRNSWDRKKNEYLSLVDTLVAGTLKARTNPSSTSEDPAEAESREAASVSERLS